MISLSNSGPNVDMPTKLKRAVHTVCLQMKPVLPYVTVWNFYSDGCLFVNISGVFTGVFTCRHIACEDPDWAAYSQLHLHVTGEYNRQQAGISCQNHRNVACHPVYTQQVSLVLAQALAKVRNFERVASKTQRVHVAAFSCLHEHC